MNAADWTGGWGILIVAAGAVVTVGGAIAIIWRGWAWTAARVRPAHPLISFGHPSETPTPWIYFVGDSDAGWECQERDAERARLGHLAVDYLIENKGTTNEDAVRGLTTGIRGPDGTEHAFDACIVQILGPGERVEIGAEEVPREMHDGMEDPDRAVNFVYWARFEDARRRRWETTYDPGTRRMDHRRI